MSQTRVQSTSFQSAAIVVAIFVNALLSGCTQEPRPPAQATPSADSFVAVLERFSKRMLDIGAPAVLIQARVNGEVWSQASGVRSLESRAKAEITDRFEVGSVTKSMVAVSVLKLVEEGAVKLDDPVGRHLAEFDSLMHPPEPVTIGQLLRHESGMPTFDEALFAAAPLREALTRPLSPEERLALAATLPWRRNLPQGFDYSNSGYEALGLIVERVRGRSLGDVLHTDIVEPLGLTGTGLMAPGPAPESMIHGYITIDGEQVDVTYPGELIGDPAGGVVSTVGDLNTFYSALLGGRLLKPETVKEMQASENGFYGAGLYRWSDPCTNDFNYGHSGDWAGYGTIAMISADGKRQLAMSVAYPPGPFSTAAHMASNPFALDIIGAAQEALDRTC